MARVMVVDDEELNVALVRAQLEDLGHDIESARCGEEALERSSAFDPDIVLLDMVMPGIGGLETLRRLKERAEPDFLPVVLLTSHDDAESRRRGLRMGADDFVTKPVDETVLSLRVENLLSLRKNQRALSARNAELARIQRSKEEMTALLVHDLRGPASVVMTNLDYVESNLGEAADPDVCEALADAREGCHRLVRLFANLLDVERAEDHRLRPHKSPVDVAELFEPLLRARALSVKARDVTLEREIASEVVYVDADLVTRMIENLLDDAARYTPRGGRIRVEAVRRGTSLRISIGSSGPCVPREERDGIFEKYGGTGKGASRKSAGFGLYFCRLAALAHGGDISLVETSDLPSVFVVELPMTAPEEAS